MNHVITNRLHARREASPLASFPLVGIPDSAYAFIDGDEQALAETLAELTATTDAISAFVGS
jgi:hypothetical protein